jgi:hypothetical protein
MSRIKSSIAAAALAISFASACDDDSNVLGTLSDQSTRGGAPGAAGHADSPPPGQAGGSVNPSGGGEGGPEDSSGGAAGSPTSGNASTAGVSNGGLPGAAGSNHTACTSGSGGAPGHAGANEPMAGSPGAAGAGGASERCGGEVCDESEYCCGPAACGRCVPLQSGAACPAQCPASGCRVQGDCRSLINNAEQKLAAARQCTGGGGSCQDIIQGVCCAVHVASIDSPEAQCALAAIADAKAAGCACLVGAPCVQLSQPGECALNGGVSGICQ